jgi:hypothetical protein
MARADCGSFLMNYTPIHGLTALSFDGNAVRRSIKSDSTRVPVPYAGVWASELVLCT